MNGRKVQIVEDVGGSERKKRRRKKKRKEKKKEIRSVTWPGIEPGPQPWKGCMLTQAVNFFFHFECEAEVLEKGDVN